VQISWSKAERQIKSDHRYQIETAADHGQFRSQLTVYDVQASDAGQFTVTAVNGFGSVTSSTALTVRGQRMVSSMRCSTKKLKLKFSDTHYRVLGPELIPVVYLNMCNSVTITCVFFLAAYCRFHVLCFISRVLYLKVCDYHTFNKRLLTYLLTYRQSARR